MNATDLANIAYTRQLNGYFSRNTGVPGWKYPTAAALLTYWAAPSLYAQWNYLRWLQRASSVFGFRMEDLQ